METTTDTWPKCGHPKTLENTRTEHRSTLTKGIAIRTRCRQCRVQYNHTWRATHPNYRRPGDMRAAWAKARLEDYDELTAWGESFDQISKRFGVQPNSLRQWLWRHGRGWAGKS